MTESRGEERGNKKEDDGMRKQKKHDLTKQDVEWLERHGFNFDKAKNCYHRIIGGHSIIIIMSVSYKSAVCIGYEMSMRDGRGETAEEAFLDFLQKHKAHIEELQSFQNELEKI